MSSLHPVSKSLPQWGHDGRPAGNSSWQWGQTSIGRFGRGTAPRYRRASEAASKLRVMNPLPLLAQQAETPWWEELILWSEGTTTALGYEVPLRPALGLPILLILLWLVAGLLRSLLGNWFGRLAERTHSKVDDVALKAMKPAVAASLSAKERFLREAQATAAIEDDTKTSSERFSGGSR